MKRLCSRTTSTREPPMTCFDLTGAALYFTRRIARHMLGPSKRLHLDFPFGAVDAAFDRQAAETISALSCAKARAVGVSKAGLWDMERRVAGGKFVRLCQETAAKVT